MPDRRFDTLVERQSRRLRAGPGGGGSARRGRLTALALIATFAAVWLMVETVDRSALAAAWHHVVRHPGELVLSLVAFAGAFGLRAVAWHRVLPALGFGQALAAVHVALGANHVLPLRLGEPLRVVSVARRTTVGWARATASTLTLRAADIASILVIGAAAGLGRLVSGPALGVAAVVSAGALVSGVLWLRRLGRRAGVAMPGPVVALTTAAAWLLESVVVWQAAQWAGIHLTPAGAVLVTAAAVLAQVVAFAPGGLGTYEAGGTAALVFLGFDPATSLAAVLAAHAVKTAYSLVAGAVAAIVPSPGLLGRFRLARPGSPPDAHAPAADGPVVLFMPAHDEGAAVASVVSRVPDRVLGRPVVCLVIDDGSTDATVEQARDAGATVISLGTNQGLGAAVRRGLCESLDREAAAVAFCDADGEYAPEELERLVAPILAGRADYVVGSRFAGEIGRMLPHRRLGNRILTACLSWIARRPITDGQSGYRAFSPAAASAAEVIHDFNYAQVITLDLLAKGFRYGEVPISYSFRTAGRSFVRLGRYLRAVAPAVYREINAS